MDEESGKEDAGYNAEEKMNIKCLFKGHEMIEGKCIRCLKNECEIRGHVWIILSFIRFGNIKLEYPNRRKCKKCGCIEECKIINYKYMSDDIIQEWHRIE